MLEIALFSYNRGQYLENCLTSVRRNLPGVPVRVYDDGSTDPATMAYLENLGDIVIRPGATQTLTLGGLYQNMQTALMAAQAEFLLFLQDDVQVVRPVSDDELAAVRQWFDENPKAAFVSPVFLKGKHRFSRSRMLKSVPGWRGYQVDADDVKRVGDKYYNDITIVHVARLRAANWQYKSPERANAAPARDAGFSPMLILGDPFVFFCPEVPFFRFKDRTLATRWADRILGRDIRRFHDMTQIEIEAFKARPLSQLPFAEDFLTPERADVRRPFVYKSVNARWYTRALHRIELALRKR